MTHGPQVDIIVATNRCGPYLSEALASVRRQTYSQWNLIVVDDGCPDPGFIPALLRSDQRATIVRSAPGGVSAARNVGIAQGRAPLVAFLDDDDVWCDDKLERQVSCLEGNSRYVASFTAGEYMNSDGSSAGWGWPARAAGRADFLRGAEPLPRIVTLMARRGILESVGGFDPALTLGEDVEFVLRLAERGEMGAVPEVGTRYRRHSANQSSKTPAETRRVLESIIRSRIAAADSRGDHETMRLTNEGLDRLYATWATESAHLIGAALRRGHLATARDEVTWAVSSAPLATARALLHRTAITLRRTGSKG